MLRRFFEGFGRVLFGRRRRGIADPTSSCNGDQMTEKLHSDGRPTQFSSQQYVPDNHVAAVPSDKIGGGTSPVSLKIQTDICRYKVRNDIV
ncbi:hypothetical protein M6B38_197230 [Iris pallida]|uniref:Uncharacterized protein n=1 Tax=Iris pallida TaxID=29817 RepID=A0AAX6ECA6_IRIPA|nr:hypothetical protein M6B38_197230 [Iris pallida]